LFAGVERLQPLLVIHSSHIGDRLVEATTDGQVKVFPRMTGLKLGLDKPQLPTRVQ
jgi:hypothetical protein